MKVLLELIEDVPLMKIKPSLVTRQVIAKIEIDGSRGAVEKIVKLLQDKFGVDNVK